jgi:hypothetical protein
LKNQFIAPQVFDLRPPRGRFFKQPAAKERRRLAVSKRDRAHVSGDRIASNVTG